MHTLLGRMRVGDEHGTPGPTYRDLCLQLLLRTLKMIAALAQGRHLAGEKLLVPLQQGALVVQVGPPRQVLVTLLLNRLHPTSTR